MHESFWVKPQLAQGNIPEEVVLAIRLGRMTALQKPDGGVRGIVVGDVFRRVVARTIAQQYAKLGEAATHPFQYALSTRAGTECVTHIVQAMTSEDREATILSIDGIGVYDFVSQNAMFKGVQTWLTATNWSRSCACSAGHHQHFSGRMMKARCITYGKEKAGSKAIH